MAPSSLVSHGPPQTHQDQVTLTLSGVVLLSAFSDFQAFPSLLGASSLANSSPLSHVSLSMRLPRIACAPAPSLGAVLLHRSCTALTHCLGHGLHTCLLLHTELWEGREPPSPPWSKVAVTALKRKGFSSGRGQAGREFGIVLSILQGYETACEAAGSSPTQSHCLGATVLHLSPSAEKRMTFLSPMAWTPSNRPNLSVSSGYKLTHHCLSGKKKKKSHANIYYLSCD